MPKDKGYTKIYGDFGEHFGMFILNIAGISVENLNKTQHNCPVDVKGFNQYLFNGQLLGINVKFRRRVFGKELEVVNLFESDQKLNEFVDFCKKKKYKPMIFVSVISDDSDIPTKSEGFYVFMSLEKYLNDYRGGTIAYTLNVTNGWIEKYKKDTEVYYVDGLVIPHIKF